MKSKFLITFGLVIFLYACDDKPNNAIIADRSEYPPLSDNSVQTPYTDNSGLIKVTAKNSEGLTEEGDYLNGLRNGNWTVYFANNYPKSITGYVEGKKQGLWISLDNRGQLQERAYYHNDKLHGEYVKYNRSRIKEEYFYENGFLEGPLKKYYPNGNIMEESNYKNGKLDGIAKWYDQEGNVTIEYEYKDGEWLNKEEEEEEEE